MDLLSQQTISTVLMRNQFGKDALFFETILEGV